MIYIVLVLGLALRLIALNQSLWLDEATSALVGQMTLSDIFNKFLPGDFHPPFYYVFLKYWIIIFGNSEISIRFPSLLFGLGTIYIVYLISKKLINEKVGIMAALLLATSGLHIYYSQEARMYSLAAFLVTFAIYLFLKKDWIWFSATLLFIGLSDYVSLFILPVFVLFMYKEWKKAIVLTTPLFIGFLVWMPTFIKQLVAGISIQGTNWWNILGIGTVKNFVLIPVKFIIGRISFDDKSIYVVIVSTLILIFGYLLFKAKKESKIIWAWFLVPIIIGVMVSIKIPTLSYFRFLFCLPAFYILIAAGIYRTTRYQNILLATLLLINFTFSIVYLTKPRFYREDWRAAAKTIYNQKIIFPYDSQKEALTYYGKGNQIISIKELTKQESEIWLSRYVTEIFDPNDLTRRELEDLGYNKTSEANFNGVVLWKYIKTK